MLRERTTAGLHTDRFMLIKGNQIDYPQEILAIPGGRMGRHLHPPFRHVKVIAENTYKIHPATSKRKVDPEAILSKIQGYLEELDAMADHPIGSHLIVPISMRQLAHSIKKAIKEFC